MTDIWNQEEMRPEAASMSTAHPINQANPHRVGRPGLAEVEIHYTDIDVIVDAHLETITDHLSHANYDRELVLEIAEEVVRLNRIARAAQAAQEAAQRPIDRT